MYNPLKLVENNFDDKNLSDADLRSFVEDHLVRLTNPDLNPGGIYNGLITDTTAKYNAYYGKITNKAVKKAIAEGTTITRNNARHAAEEKIDSLQGLVKFKFGENSATYQELYPLGLTEYSRAHEGDIGTLFDRFVVAATTHLTADFPNEVTAIDDLVDDFHSAVTARESVVTQVDVLITGKNADRGALTLQLCTNFLTVALNNLMDPDKFDDYYNDFYLPLDRTTSGIVREGELPFPGFSVIDTTDINLIPKVKIRLHNPGNTTDRYYFSNVPNVPPGPSSPFFDVQPGQTVTKTAEDLGFSEFNMVFMVQNAGMMPGLYKVTIGV